MRIGGCLALVALLLCPAAATAQVDPAQIPAPIDVVLSRSDVSTRIGDGFGFRSRITNTGAQALPALVAHLNVVGLDTDTYVDPEDWSEERTKSVRALTPGESTDVSWDVTAVTGGDAAIYVTALPDDSPAKARFRVAASPAMDVHVAAAKDFNTGGVLPLAVGVPAVIGLATLGVRRRRR
jgi:hypothetical protein